MSDFSQELDESELETWLDKNPNFVKDYLKTRPYIFESNIESTTSFDHYLSDDSLNIPRLSLVNDKTKKNSTIYRSISEDFCLLKPQDRSSNHLVSKSHGFNLLRNPDEMIKLEMLRTFDPDALLNELIQDIGNETNMESLCFKILVNVCFILNCDRCSMFLVEDDPQTGEKFLVAKVFDANIQHASNNTCAPIRVPIGSGIVGHVAQTGVSVNLEDDPHFNQEIDMQTEYKTQSVICHPIKNTSGKIFEKYLVFCGIVIINAQLIERYSNEIEQNKDSIELIINKILTTIFELIKCQACLFYLKETESNRNLIVTGWRKEILKCVENHRQVEFCVNSDIYSQCSFRGSETLWVGKDLKKALGIFCGMALVNTQIRDNLNKALAKQQESIIPSASELGLNLFEFDDENLSDIDTYMGIIRIFKDLDFITTFEIEYKVDIDGQEKLSSNNVPQLEACFPRHSIHVLLADGKPFRNRKRK
ncbi:hypothetical protein RF11_12233 [Thelohanellus kitauei]|uniref:GAF domain-containing protein n=1 Tax=Thelohanellus kitauei TaxID=669202 RepID=A0A0C2J177_THEKT|nr:hypothetical protein RF11_12233 [Thelohanellus kitauei]